MESLRIAAFSLVAGIGYGILHDQVTAHLCVEYFTIAHPIIFPTQSPALLAFGWGILATWWLALPFGILLAVGSQFGRWPKRGLSDVRGSILKLLAFTGLCATAAGLLGGYLAHHGFADTAIAFGIAEDRQALFMADVWAHTASYLVAAIGAMVLVVMTGVSRYRDARARHAN